MSAFRLSLSRHQKNCGELRWSVVFRLSITLSFVINLDLSDIEMEKKRKKTERKLKKSFSKQQGEKYRDYKKRQTQRTEIH